MRVTSVVHSRTRRLRRGLHLCVFAWPVLFLAAPSMAAPDAVDCFNGNLAVPAACEWATVAGDGDTSAQALLRGDVTVLGSVCGGSAHLREWAYVYGNVVVTASSGRASLFGPAATVTGNIVTGGAPIAGSPGRSKLPGMDTDTVAAGDCLSQRDVPGRLLDATGQNPLTLDCQDAIDSIPSSATVLDSTAFGSTDDQGSLAIPDRGTVTIMATKTVNVIDFVRLVAGKRAVLTLDGNSIPNAVFVLRVNKETYFHPLSRIELKGGARPERVIVYGRGDCKIGRHAVGSGTLFCPYSSVRVAENVTWRGAFISGNDGIDVRRLSYLSHVPLEVTVPAN